MNGQTHRVLGAILAATVIAAACQPADSDVPATTGAGDGQSDLVGVVGCSVTLDALRGYHLLDGKTMWPPEGLNYGLGTISAWAEPDTEYWRQFEMMLEANSGTTAIWWQLCAGNGDDSLENALMVLDVVNQLAPEAEIYVSAQPGYSESHVCPIAGADGPDDMARIAEALVSDHGVGIGPDMSVLAVEFLRDNCHADRAGREIQGQILIDFFGA